VAFGLSHLRLLLGPFDLLHRLIALRQVLAVLGQLQQVLQVRVFGDQVPEGLGSLLPLYGFFEGLRLTRGVGFRLQLLKTLRHLLDLALVLAHLRIDLLEPLVGDGLRSGRGDRR